MKHRGSPSSAANYNGLAKEGREECSHSPLRNSSVISVVRSMTDVHLSSSLSIVKMLKC